MKPVDVLVKVANIAAMAADGEAAHCAEDDLHAEVLEAIARGGITLSDARECALAACQTKDIDFARWCA